VESADTYRIKTFIAERKIRKAETVGYENLFGIRSSLSFPQLCFFHFKRHFNKRSDVI